MPEITMPRLSDTMQEGKVARWLKQPGEPVARGDVLAEIETDKATMELEAYDGGVLERILVGEGETAPIGQAIAVLGAGDGAAAPPAAPVEAPPAAPAEAQPAAQAPAQPTAQAPAAAESGAAAPEPAASVDTTAAAPEPAGSVETTATADTCGPAPVGANPPAVQPETRPPTDAAGAEPAAQRVRIPPAAAALDAADAASADPVEVKASPMARAIARERGVDLHAVRGSGPGGRIIRADVEALGTNGHAASPSATAAPAPATTAQGAAASPAATPDTTRAPTATPESAATPPAPAASAGTPAPSVSAAPATGDPAGAPSPADDVELRPVSRVHQVMAQRTLQSVRDIPQYYLTSEIDMHAALDLRRQLEEAFGDNPRITINAIILRAVALALREIPEVNSSWRDGQWALHRRVHLGVAVAVPDGLIVPVIRDADQKALREIAVETRALASRARDGKLALAEVQGSTFSVTNLGMFDVEEFHGIINPPEAGLLAIGAVIEKPVGLDGQIVLRPRMRVTLSADHRAYSGDVGARFLQAVKHLLEHPLRLGF